MKSVFQGFVRGWMSVTGELPSVEIIAASCADAHLSPIEACRNGILGGCESIEKRFVSQASLDSGKWTRIEGGATKQGAGGKTLFDARPVKSGAKKPAKSDKPEKPVDAKSEEAASKPQSAAEKEIADTIAEHKARDANRKTPRKGESARQELDAAVDEAWSEYDKATDAEAEARRVRDSKKLYSKARDAADKKYQKAKESSGAAHGKWAKIKEQHNRAILEDHAESGHPLKSEIAKLHLLGPQDQIPWQLRESRKRVENALREKVLAHVEKLAPAAAAAADGHGVLSEKDEDRAVDAAIGRAVQNAMSHPGNIDKLESDLAGYIRGERLERHRSAANKKIDALENKMPSKVRDKFDFKDIDDHVAEQVAYDKDVKAQAAAEKKARAAQKKKFLTDFDAPDAHVAKPLTPKQLANTIAGAQRGRYDFHATAKETGWATDGRFLMKLPQGESLPDTKFAANGRVMSQDMIDNVISGFSVEDKIEVTGSRPEPVSIYDEPSGKIQIRLGDDVVVDGQLHATIMRRYPNAEIYHGKGSGSVRYAAIYKVGNETVGVVMGFDKG